MLTRKDVENAIAEANEILQESDQDGPEWEYWRDSGEFHVWRSTDDEWLLQVSHETGRLGFTNLSGNSTVEIVAIGYAGDAAASAIVTGYVGNPDVVYEGMKQKDEATVIEQDLDL